jgi:hypothetical protein
MSQKEGTKSLPTTKISLPSKKSTRPFIRRKPQLHWRSIHAKQYENFIITDDGNEPHVLLAQGNNGVWNPLGSTYQEEVDARKELRQSLKEVTDQLPSILMQQTWMASLLHPKEYTKNIQVRMLTERFLHSQALRIILALADEADIPKLAQLLTKYPQDSLSLKEKRDTIPPELMNFYNHLEKEIHQCLG